MVLVGEYRKENKREWAAGRAWISIMAVGLVPVSLLCTRRFLNRIS